MQGSPDNIELTAQGVDKGTALLALADLLHIPREATVAVGDSENDRAMLEKDTYESGAKYLSYFLTPATVALAVPLYEQIEPLKKNWKAILAGIFAGAMTSALCVLVLSLIFKLSHKQYVTLLPKSITTAIGMGLSEELGGIVTITVAVIIVTGVIGNMFAENICKLFHISDPVAKGVGIGSASHAMGTSKAMEMGEIEGAMSSLSIAVSGLMTVVVSLIFSHIY